MRAARLAFVCLLLALTATPGAAQGGADVLQVGREHGVAPPAALRDYVRAHPDAFDFRRVWKGRVAEMVRIRGSMLATRPAAGSGDALADIVRGGGALTGTFRVPVVLGRFGDVAEPYPSSQLQDRLFGSGAGTYSLTQLYDEMSGGLFTYTGDVIGWDSLPGTRSYYETPPAGSWWSSLPYGNAPAFMFDALAAADPAVDFGLYDNDGPDGVPNSGDDDGYVDLVAFMYPGIGQECGGDATGIWAHRWQLEKWGLGGYTTDDPSNAPAGGMIRVSDYILQGGEYCDGGLQQIGVVAHESGHGFGLPDLYDTDPSNGAGEGIGHWGLMGSGNWNTAASPAHFSAFSEAYLGWIQVATLDRDSAGVLLPPVQTGRVAYRVDIVTSAGEYFLLANRQRLGSDQYAHAAGLLVWHVDSATYMQRLGSNTVNADASREGVALVQADGRRDMEKGVNRGDAGDAFPGSTANTLFSPTTTPSSAGNRNGASGVTLASIRLQGSDAVFDLLVPERFVWGDVTGDGVIDGADVQRVLAYAAGTRGPDYLRVRRGDVDDDGDVDLRDALAVQAYVAGRGAADFRIGTPGIEGP